ncbi:hypothetical protein OH77DRAFT_1419168, partial [Trametes cingulata]
MSWASRSPESWGLRNAAPSNTRLVYQQRGGRTDPPHGRGSKDVQSKPRAAGSALGCQGEHEHPRSFCQAHILVEEHAARSLSIRRDKFDSSEYTLKKRAVVWSTDDPGQPDVGAILDEDVLILLENWLYSRGHGDQLRLASDIDRHDIMSSMPGTARDASHVRDSLLDACHNAREDECRA